MNRTRDGVLRVDSHCRKRAREEAQRNCHQAIVLYHRFGSVQGMPHLRNQSQTVIVGGKWDKSPPAAGYIRWANRKLILKSSQHQKSGTQRRNHGNGKPSTCPREWDTTPWLPPAPSSRPELSPSEWL